MVGEGMETCALCIRGICHFNGAFFSTDNVLNQ